MASILEKVLRTGDKKVLRRLRSYADAINTLEDGFREFTDAELRAETDAFRQRIEDGESLDRMLPEAFAVVREASHRVLGKRHYDVQLMGGAALHLGNIAEMKTGEGKTLVATAPAYLNALAGKGVHVITVNDYLASSQAEQMGRVYRFLGMETGTILAGQTPDVRRKQYAADITYGTNNEFGFDYLRDNMAWSVDELVQRGHSFAIVDEVDSILIDEARTPLIISGPASGEANRWYSVFASLVERLDLDTDYEADEKKRTVSVLEPGIDKVEDWLGIENLYDTSNTPLIGFLNNALKAKELFTRDKDYVVMKGEVQIVDEHTGRILKGRRYNEGQHQAIEAKEKVKVKPENQTMATITLQNYFRLYDKLSGMTGTAETEAAEFMNTYELGVVAIETNRPMVRQDREDLVYKNEVVKFAAVVQDIEQRHETGQPVLVGTTSVEKSEYLSKLLSKRGVRHEVLNAKNNEREAAIVAQAGRKGSVTVATNMAGRGTDIILGGNAEAIAMERMKELGLDPDRDPEAYEQKWPEVLETAEQEIGDEHEVVRELGGLYVLGTERHESRRIDNQLRGRAGRQGDPGESRFYLSLNDDLMRLFNAGGASRLMANAAEDTALEFRIVSRAIASAQNMVEGRNAEQRKNVLKYDDVLNRQRTAIYADRRRILEGHDLQDQVQQFIREVVGSIVVDKTSSGHPEDWDLEQLWESLRTVYPVSVSQDELIEEAGGRDRLSTQFLREQLISDAEVVYEEREEQIGSEAMRNLERRVVLSVLGRKWPEHLYEMDYLKDGIGLRAMAQRDPLVEYQREGHIMYQNLMDGIREETVTYLFSVDLKAQRAGAGGGPLAAGLPKQPTFLQYSAPTESGRTQVRTERSGAQPAGSAGATAPAGAAKSTGRRSAGTRTVKAPAAGKASVSTAAADAPSAQDASTQGASARGGDAASSAVDPSASGSEAPAQPAPRSRAERRAAEARAAREARKQTPAKD